jgi:hypothetical protein
MIAPQLWQLDQLACGLESPRVPLNRGDFTPPLFGLEVGRPEITVWHSASAAARGASLLERLPLEDLEPACMAATDRPASRAAVALARRPAPEVPDILRAHGAAYRVRHRVSPQQARVMQRLSACRTAALGGHVDTCERCGFAAGSGVTFENGGGAAPRTRNGTERLRRGVIVWKEHDGELRRIYRRRSATGPGRGPFDQPRVRRHRRKALEGEHLV